MEPKRILWVRLDAIGDNVLAASMLPHIYEKYNNPRITAVCQQHISELYEASPFVHEVIGVDKMRLFLDAKYRNEIVLELRRGGFDTAIDSTCSWLQLADLFLVGSQAREKIAFENPAQIPASTMAKRRKVFTHLVKFTRPYEPEMERYCDFLKDLGIDVPALNATVWTTADDDEFAGRIFAENGLIPGKTVALFAFGRSHLRTYPYYGEALSNVCKENDFSVVALGDSAAYGFNQNCLKRIGVRSVNLSGKTTLRQTASILRKCRIAVGAETGLAHMACAVGVPNVIVIGGGHMGRFMPYSPKTSLVTLPLECFDCDWSCRFKRAHCVNDIAPAVVEFAVRETLRKDSDKPRLFVHPQSRWQQTETMPLWKMAGKFVNAEDVEVISAEFEPNPGGDRPTDDHGGAVFPGYTPTEKPAAVEIAVQKAIALREGGNVEDAIAILDDAIDKNAEFPDLMNLKAELNLQAGRIEEAKEILWRTVSTFPFNVELLNNIAVVEIIQRRYDSALGILRRLLDIEPRNEVALSNLRFIENDLLVRGKLIDAEQSILNNEYEFARKLLNEILEANPGHEDALADLALVDAYTGRYDVALKSLQKALSINPQNEYVLQLMQKFLLKEQ